MSGPAPTPHAGAARTRRAAPVATPVATNPYPGPRPFREDDGEWLFGRDAEIATVGYRILANPAYLVYACSGAGKSSLVRAGVCPWLARNGAVVRVVPSLRAAAAAAAARRPGVVGDGGNDLAALAARAVAEGSAAGGDVGRDEEWHRARTRVLVFDQLEELFELDGARWTERRGFFETIAEACTVRTAQPTAQPTAEADAQPEPPPPPVLHVVLVVREEYLAKVMSYASCMPGALEARLHLDPLNAEGALAAIQGPAARAGDAWSDDAAKRLCSKLLQGGEFVDTTILQVVCRDLWERRPRSTRGAESETAWLEQLEREGLFERALAGHYLAAVERAATPWLEARGKAGADPAERVQAARAVADWIEDALVRGDRRTLFVWSRDANPVVRADVIEALEDGHLVQTVTHRDGQRIVELTHDRFVPVIRAENETLRAAAEYCLPPSPDEGSIVGFVDRTAYFVARSMRLARVEQEEMQARLALPGDDTTSHFIGEAHFCLGVLEGHLPFARLLPESYRHLEGTLLDDVRRLRAYLTWQRRQGRGDALENYYTACNRLRARAPNLHGGITGPDYARWKAHVEAEFLDAEGRLDDRKPGCHALVKMKAEQVWNRTGRARRDEDNWREARRQVALFYENVLGAIERGDAASLEGLREAASGDLARSVDCLEAAVVLTYVDPGAIQQYQLV